MAKKKQTNKEGSYLIIQNMEEGTLFAGEVKGGIFGIHSWPRKIGKKRFLGSPNTNYNMILIQDAGGYLSIVQLSATPQEYADMGFIDRTIEEAYEGCEHYLRALSTSKTIIIEVGTGNEKTKGLLKKIFSGE